MVREKGNGQGRRGKKKRALSTKRGKKAAEPEAKKGARQLQYSEKEGRILTLKGGKEGPPIKPKKTTSSRKEVIRTRGR